MSLMTRCHNRSRVLSSFIW